MIRASAVAMSAMMLALPARAAVTFDQAKVFSNASADVGQTDGDTSGTGFGSQNRTLSTPGDVLATAQAQANGSDAEGLGDASGSALEQSHASFTSASSGYLDLAGITSATTSDAVSTAEAYSEGQSGSYTFAVDAPSVLTINYIYSETYTDPYFDNSVYVGTSNFSATDYSSSNQGNNTSGVIRVDLGPGTYLFDASTQEGDYAYAAGGASTYGSHEELYNFSVSAAPEPSTWALMIVGLGGVGLMLRRRSRRAASPSGAALTA